MKSTKDNILFTLMNLFMKTNGAIDRLPCYNMANSFSMWPVATILARKQLMVNGDSLRMFTLRKQLIAASSARLQYPPVISDVRLCTTPVLRVRYQNVADHLDCRITQLYFIILFMSSARFRPVCAFPNNTLYLSWLSFRCPCLLDRFSQHRISQLIVRFGGSPII